VIPTAGPYFLPRVLPGLRSAHPDLRLLLREEQTARLVERLKGGELDLALLALPVEDDSLEETPLYDEPFVAAVPEGHPLASRPFVTEGDLIRERLLLLEDGHCLREQALALCGRASRRDEEGFAATSLATLREMVAGRIGVTLMPLLSVTGPSAPSGGISLVPFAPPRAGRRIGLVWRRHAAREADFRALASFLRAHLPEGVVPVGEEALS
jgi:LysR family hydrogen peroxide-inducible transcriptional activator